jgi:hypothetical protein
MGYGQPLTERARKGIMGIWRLRQVALAMSAITLRCTGASVYRVLDGCAAHANLLPVDGWGPRRDGFLRVDGDSLCDNGMERSVPNRRPEPAPLSHRRHGRESRRGGRSNTSGCRSPTTCRAFARGYSRARARDSSCGGWGRMQAERPVAWLPAVLGKAGKTRQTWVPTWLFRSRAVTSRRHGCPLWVVRICSPA